MILHANSDRVININDFFQTHKLCENLLKNRFQGLNFFRILRVNYIKNPLTVFICLKLHCPAFVTHISDFLKKKKPHKIWLTSLGVLQRQIWH